MKKKDRYDTSELAESQFEPGSRCRVLKNLFGIKSKREMDRIEAEEQFRALEKLFAIYDSNHKFTSADICQFHKIWLGSIYEWAGRYRQVNISKGDFHFAMAEHIPYLMKEFECKYLAVYTPCNYSSDKESVKALAVVHTELILIHPFREGNGRAARMLSTLMALQAGLPPLDYKSMAGDGIKDYYKAVQAGMSRNYSLMEKIFTAVLRSTLHHRKQ